jgi:hypothetical protein
LAVVSSVLLGAAYVMYASGILMPSSKSGRVSMPDLSGNAAASQPAPASPTTQQIMLMAGSKSKAPIFTPPATKPVLLPGSKAPARLVEPPAQTQTSPPASQPAKPILIHGSKSARIELPTPQYTNDTVPNPKP